jgi:hypothetical protein
MAPQGVVGKRQVEGANAGLALTEGGICGINILKRCTGDETRKIGLIIFAAILVWIDTVGDSDYGKNEFD